MKTACVYHSVDLDGWMSAAIVKHWFKMNNRHYLIQNIGSYSADEYNSELISELRTNSELNVLSFIGYNYGQPIPDLSEYDRIVMCDISLPKEEMQCIQKRIGSNFIWIDHHISAMKEVQELFPVSNGWLDTKFAACELTWKYFFPDEQMPEIVRLLGRYDCFGHKGTDEEQKVLEFQYGARQCITNYEEAYNWLVTDIANEKFPPSSILQERGKSIYQYLCVDARQSYKNGFDLGITLTSNNSTTHIEETFKFICINKDRFNPINFGIDYHSDGYDGCACFYFDGNHYNFSLYNDNGLVDCSVIAKQYGGGGHRGASGFRLTQDQFTALINSK